MYSRFSKYFLLSITIGLISGISDASLAAESSIIPFQLIPTSKPMLHLGGLDTKTGVKALSGLQLQPTANLLLGGVMSPRQENNDLSLYYHLLVGYIPKWKLLKISSNLIQLGMHRYRFSAGGDRRWFSFSVTESTKLGFFKLNLCWNRLFTQKWERNTVFISTDIKISDNFYLRPGTLASFTPEVDYSPFLIMSLGL